MHKIINIMAGISLLAFSASAQNTYIVNGKFTDLKAERKVLLTYMLMGKQHTDSTITKNGRFSFKGKISEDAYSANLAFLPLKVDPSVTAIERQLKSDKKDFFLCKGITLVSGGDAIKKAKIMGGKAQSEFMELEAFVKPEADELDRIEGEIIEMYIKTQAKGLDTVRRFRTLSLQVQPFSKLVDKKRDVFLKKHPDSYVSLCLLEKKAEYKDIDSKTFEPLFNSLSVRLRNTATGKMLAENLKIAKKRAVGVTAIGFSLPDVNGKPISLSSYRGKYVLVDFWASWCHACRFQNSYMLKAYQQFKDKNFDVLAISLDKDKEKWLKAVKEDALPWAQVSDLKGEIADLYSIVPIPQNFLIDPNGVIVAVNLRGDDLVKRLQQIIK